MLVAMLRLKMELERAAAEDYVFRDEEELLFILKCVCLYRWRRHNCVMLGWNCKSSMRRARSNIKNNPKISPRV
jgi:hypothetical protein